jgi:hypothetical protein
MPPTNVPALPAKRPDEQIAAAQMKLIKLAGGTIQKIGRAEAEITSGR